MSRRSKSKTAALKKTYTTKVRQEFLDYDYIEKLSEEEKEWLNKFTEEYLHGSFKKTPSKKNYSSKNLHKTKKARNELWNDNNHRNNDVYGVTKGNGMLKNAEHLVEHLEKKSERSAGQVEDDVINVIDFKYGNKDDE